jgi:hypothetical protein
VTALPEPIARPARYEVSLLPEDDINYRYYALKVERRRDGSWVVTDGVCWMDAELVFHDRPYEECLHDLDTALQLAREAAPHVIVNGITAAQARRRTQERGSQ